MTRKTPFRSSKWRDRSNHQPSKQPTWELRPAISKAVAAAVVGLIAGYLSALIISPDQLYRRVFLPDVNNFSGQWEGRLGGQIAQMRLSDLTINGVRESGKYIGTLSVGNRLVDLTGSADSRASFTGEWSDTETLELSLFRLVPDVRTEDETFIQLEGYKDEPAAHLCPKAKQGQPMGSFSVCTEIPGLTHFFR